jgi:transcriptional regulator with XRE-family HTH domain
LINIQLSEVSGVPLGTLNNFLGTAVKEPKTDVVIKLANALNVSTDYLIFGETIGLSQEAVEIAQRYEAADKRIRDIVQIALDYQVSNTDINEELEFYRRELEAEENGLGKSSASQEEKEA